VSLFGSGKSAGSISGRIMPVPDAVTRFMDDVWARRLTPASLAKIFVVLEKQLVPWAEGQQIRYVSQLDVERLRQFRETWADGAVSAVKKLVACRRSSMLSRTP
jgi:hypothetical protein